MSETHASEVAAPVRDGVLDAVGHTPLVRLRRLFPDAGYRLYGKLEGLNPGGSIKDRPAREILEGALASGAVAPGGVVVESSSGNMGIGLAQVCRFHGLRLLCVVDTKATEQNLRVLRAYGAEIEKVTEPDPVTGEWLEARLRRVRELCRRIPGAFWPNQYANELNPRAHYRTTMDEIASALEGRVDYVFAATSTCGTVRGCSEYVRDHGLRTTIVAVDAVGSLIYGGPRVEREIPGLGAGITPPLHVPELVDRFVQVTDRDCVAGCRELVRREAILTGGSAGGVVAAFARLRHEIPPGSECVLLLCDRGERYLDTVYSDEWARRCFGEVPRGLDAETPSMATRR